MSSPNPTSDAVLRLCAAVDPNPWFPSQYAQDTGTVRDALDAPLNQLRIAGLMRIGGWHAGRGQCYVLTDEGRAALADPRALARLLDGTALAEIAAPTPRPDRLTAWDRGEAVRKALLAPGRAPATWALLILQVGVFGLGLGLALEHHVPASVYFERGLSPIMVWLAVSDIGVSAGEWWRLITYSAVHAGGLHLLMNSLALLTLGPLMERALGSVRFLILWLLGALGGGVAVVLTGSSAVGASGSLCGLVAAALAFIWLNRQHLGPRASSDSLRRLGTVALLTVLISFAPNVSWAGHLGGAIAGLVGGVLLTYHRFGTAEQRWAALLGLVLLPIAGLAPLVEKGILHLHRPAGINAPGGVKDMREPTDASGSIRGNRSLSRW